MCPYPWYQVMKLSKDKKQQRYVMPLLSQGIFKIEPSPC